MENSITPKRKVAPTQSPEDLESQARQIEIDMQKRATIMFRKLEEHYGQTTLMNMLEKEADLGQSVILNWLTRDMSVWPSYHNRETISRVLKRLSEQMPKSQNQAQVIVTAEKRKPKTIEEYGFQLSEHWGNRIFSQDEIRASDAFLEKLLERRIVMKARAVSGIKMYKIAPSFLQS